VASIFWCGVTLWDGGMTLFVRMIVGVVAGTSDARGIV
jgi:hypothetical protein